ncbi:Uncharacterised protein [Nocardia otitidiscaviarum]|uniref:Uncharacterized protein n=1 Tax=Nocardia otitidiscaviarum TaxID=1823 RepID=A0A378YR18_9NOCA|nr:Uncharacterised protein [Nocardia otitidiscaviarum]
MTGDSRYAGPNVPLALIPAELMMYILDCTTDPGELTPEQSHQAMQLHMCCTVDDCRVRRRARQILVDAGQMVLDDRAAP